MTNSRFVNINPVTPSNPVRLTIKNGGNAAITLDQTLPNFFTALRVGGTDGNIVVQNVDDSGTYFTYTIRNAQKAEGYIQAVGNKVLSSGTTATDIWWYTG